MPPESSAVGSVAGAVLGSGNTAAAIASIAAAPAGAFADPATAAASSSGKRNGASENAGPMLHVSATLLGSGASGAVHLGAWRGMLVAVKALLVRGDLHGQAAKERALQEAALALSMNHPHVVATLHYELRPLGVGLASGSSSSCRPQTFSSNSISCGSSSSAGLGVGGVGGRDAAGQVQAVSLESISSNGLWRLYIVLVRPLPYLGAHVLCRWMHACMRMARELLVLTWVAVLPCHAHGCTAMPFLRCPRTGGKRAVAPPCRQDTAQVAIEYCAMEDVGAGLGG